MSELNSGRRPHIVVVGSINMDLVVRCGVLPRPGETLSGSSFAEIPGGKGANQAVAAARLGAHVTMIGRVGDDAFGATLKASLERDGIDTDCVHTTAGISSGLAVISVEDSGQNSIIVLPGANGRLTTDDVKAASQVIRDADVVLLQFEVPMAVIAETIRIARTSKKTKIIVDPAPASKELPPEIFQADWLCPNETEAEALSGQAVSSPEDSHKAARWLRSKGVTNPVITMGAQGIVWCDETGQCRTATPFAVTPVDTTAAGDAFAGALGVALAEGMSNPNALRFACATGALATTKPGAQPAIPTRDVVEQLLQTQPEAARL
ncbi:MAG: ribokinase [Planctomycetaceae bacterium]|nr:ribokinase [Planctomycetaceae bacterium]